MAEQRILTTKKGHTVVTTMTDLEAIEALRAQQNRSAFGNDLLAKLDLYGLSADQMVWVHRLVVDRQAEEAEAALRFPRILAVFARAIAAGLKRPKIRLSEVVLSYCTRGKAPGSIAITSRGSFETRLYYGRIQTDGSLQLSRDASSDPGREAIELVKQFETDPAKVSSLHGRLQGSCCFCGRALETKESISVGYGPQCAVTYSLPWGDTTGYDEQKAAIIGEVLGQAK